MIFIPVLVVMLILGVYLKWLNDYGKKKKKKRQTELKNALVDFKSQLNVKK